jgi:hypothetical protein
MVSGALVIAFVVFSVAFIVREGLRQAWPDEYVVFAQTGSDGMVEWLDTPINTARQLIAYFAVALGGLALGSGLLQAFHGWRAKRQEGRT